MKPPLRTVLICGGILVTLTVIMGFVFGGDSAPGLATEPVTIADIEDTVIATGTLEAAQMVTVGAQASGRIESLKVKLGDYVKAGALIAEIDSTTQKNDVDNASAALTSTRALRNVQIATLKKTEGDFERQKTMLTDEATSRADYEAAEATLKITRAQIQALDAQILQAQTALATAEANLRYTRVTAPMDGTVVAIVAREGQTVNAAQDAPPIVKLAKLETMLVNANISEADVNRVKQGKKVYFTILGNPKKRYYGTLSDVAPAPKSLEAEASSPAGTASSSGNTNQAVYYPAFFEVPNPEGELRISMTAQVYVVLGEAENALTIPSIALGEGAEDGTYTVRVVNKEGKVESRKVTIGINNNDRAQVLTGLSEGEKVVVGEASSDAAKAESG